MKYNISFLFFLSFFLLSQCRLIKKESAEPSISPLAGSNMAGSLTSSDGETIDWEGIASIEQTSWDNTMIQTTNTNDGSILQIILRDSIHTGDFPIRENFYCHARLFKNDVNHISSQMTIGNLTISQIDTLRKTISGNFKIAFYLPDNSGMQKFSFQNGTFTNLPFSKRTSTPKLYFRAIAEGDKYEATTTTVDINEWNSSNLETTNDNGSKIRFDINSSEMSRLNTDHTSTILYYTSPRGYGNATKGKFQITYWNKWKKVIGGTFAYSVFMKNYMGMEMITPAVIKDGAFFIRYE